jgi:signal transduction histidine kinase
MDVPTVPSLGPPAAPERAAAGFGGLRAVAAGLLVTATVAADLAGGWSRRHDGPTMSVFLVLILVETLVSVVVGVLVARRHPSNAVGWLLMLHGAGVAVVLSGGDGSREGGGRLVALVDQLGQGSWPLLYVNLALVAFVFPDGRFPSPQWRRFVWGCLAGYVAFFVAAAFDVSSFRTDYPRLQPQLPQLPTVLVDTLGTVGLAAIATSLVGAVLCARARLRTARGEDRLRMLWFAWAALGVPGGLAACWLDYWLTGGNGTITVAGVTVTGSVLPLAIGVAILRQRLFDIELVLSRTLVYGTLTALVVTTYAAIVWLLGSLAGDRGLAGLVAVGVVAVVIQPTYSRLRRRVERWVYGDRSDPSAALRRLSDRLEDTLDAEQVVASVTESVAEALRVEHVLVDLDPDSGGAGGAPLAGASEPDRAVSVPLTYQGRRLGRLLVQVPSGRTFSEADRRLLDDLARHAAVAINAVHLTLDLQRSRARLVSAQEEERRRLRRDLHDGLGPALAAIVLKLNAADAMAEGAERVRVMGEIRAETKGAITEIRRLVDDLRPPALDEVGLVAALRQRASSMTPDHGGGSGPRFDVDGPDSLALPAAVEVAAYRIATEAMTNVVRHSGATRCSVTITVNGALEVVVVDNGSGAWNLAREGVGWTSMRERAGELGGSCTIAARTEGGTLVRAVLPLRSPDRSRVAVPQQVSDERRMRP